MNKTKVTYKDEEDYIANCYLFAPSISQHKSIGGKTYYVRRYFKGDTDFEKTLTHIAAKQSYKKRQDEYYER